MQKQRLKLLERLNQFHNQTGKFWPNNASYIQAVASEPIGAEDWQDCDEDLPLSDEESPDANPFTASPQLQGPHSAERLPLALPSAMGLQKCTELGYAHFAQVEKSLRFGQLNDALQNIRLGLSQKAVVFRQGFRNVKSKVKKTRSWHQIAQVDSNVRHFARVYTRARSAIVRLGATEEELDRYKILARADLNVSTARVDPSARGNRDRGLAWFWTMDVAGDSDAAEGMAECKCCFESSKSTMLTCNRSLPRALAKGKISHESMGGGEISHPGRNDLGAYVFYPPSGTMALEVLEVCRSPQFRKSMLCPENGEYVAAAAC